MKNLTCIISLLGILLLHNLSFAQNADILPLSQGTFFTQTIQLRQGIGDDPRDLAITPDGRKAVIASQDSNTVSIIDLENNQVIAIILVGSWPWALAITPDGRKSAVVNWLSDTVSIIDLEHNHVMATVPVGNEPKALAITPDGRKAVVANSGSGTVSIIDLENNQVTATIPVGRVPEALAITPDGRKAVVANSGSNAVSIIDLRNNNVIATILVGRLPKALAITPDGRKAVVTNSGSATVSIIDLENNDVMATIPVEARPWGLAITPDGRKAVVANYISDTVSIIDLENNQVIATIPVGDRPWGLAITPDGRKAVVANSESDTASIIDLGNNQLIATIPVGDGPWDLAITPDGRRAVVANRESGTVSIIDPENNQVITTIPAGDTPASLVITPDGRKAVVANSGSGSVSIIDLGNNQVLETIPVGDRPWGLAITPDGKKAVVTNRGSGSVSILELENSQVMKTIPVGDAPWDLAITPDGRKAVVANRGSGSVSILELENSQVMKTIPVGDAPWDLAITPDGRKAVVANRESGTVSILDLENNQVIATIPIGYWPGALAITPDGKKVVVIHHLGAVSIIDLGNNQVMATIPVGDWPEALAITPDGKKAVVANLGSSTVSIIDLGNNQVIATISIGDRPTAPIPVVELPAALAITPDGRKAVVANRLSDTVSIIDLDTSGVMKNIKVGINPGDLAITPDGSRVLVANPSSQNISIVGEIGTIILSNEVINITKADEILSVTATVYDTAGKPVKDIPILFTSTNPNIVLVERGAVTDANGKASVLLTPLRKGTANLFAQFEDLRSNLTTVHVTQDLEIIPLPVSDKPFSVLVTVIPDFTGCKSIGRVTVLDAYGNPIPNAEVDINLSIKARTNEEGVAEVELCLGGKGGLSATVSATAAGVESEKIFFDFAADTPQPIEEITFSPASISLTEGDPILGGKPFLLTARVSPPQEGVKVNFFSTDPRVAEVVGRSGVTDSNGEAKITLLPKVAGSCELIAQASRFVSQPIPVEVEKIRVSEVRIEGKKAKILGGGGGPGKVMGETLPTTAGGGPLQARSRARVGPARARLYAQEGEAGSILTAAVFPPQEGVEVRFTIDRPEVASVEIRTFTDANGIATARVDFVSDGEATITAHVLRAPTSNPAQEKAVGILPPSVLGSVIEAISRMGMDGARVSLLEEPERGAMTTTGGGAFWIQAIRRAQASFKVEAEGYFSRVEQLNLLSLPEQVVFPLTQDRLGTKDQAVNDPPMANAQTVTTNEDASKDITLTGSDPDGDPLTFAVATQPSYGTLTGTAPDLTYTPSVNFNGSDAFTFQVNDGTADSAPVTVSLIISPVNDAPVLTSLGNKSVKEGQLLTFNLSASDVEESSLTFSASNLPPGASFDPAARRFSWTPTLDQAGTYTGVRFSVSDGTSTDFEEITLTVANALLPQEAAYAHLIAVMDRYQAGDAPRLPESYTATPTFEAQRNVAHLYDSVLALLAFLDRGTAEELSRAGAIAEAWVSLQQNDPLNDGGLRDAYPADSLLDGNGKARFQLASSHTGNLAWAILGLLRYHQAQGGEKFLEAAIKIGEWIAQKTLDTRGAGGFAGGVDEALQPIRWKSTEHNLDLYAAFMRLYQATTEKRWLGWAAHARAFVEAMWDTGEAHFWTGTTEDGITINREPIPLDVQAWAVLALGKGYKGGLDWSQQALRREPCECGQLKGYRFSTGGGGCWFEGSAHLSLARRAVGEEADAEILLGELREVQASAPNHDGGGIVAACSDGVETGYGWSYFNSLHVGATAWYLLAERGVNPLEEPAGSIGPSVSGTIQDSKKLPVSGVQVEARGADGTLVGVGITGAQGSYRLALPAGPYILTPAKETHLFAPASRKITVKAKDLGKVSFTVKLLTLSGAVKDKKGKPFAGVTLRLRLGETTVTTAVTDAKGKYSFSLYNTGTYIVVPSRGESRFDPENRAVTLIKGNQGGVNFKEVP